MSLFVWTQLNNFKYSKWEKCSNQPKDGTLTGTTTLGQSGPGSNGNEWAAPHSSKLQDLGFTIKCSLMLYQRQRLGGGSLFCKDAVIIFYRPSQLGHLIWHKIKNISLPEKSVVDISGEISYPLPSDIHDKRFFLTSILNWCTPTQKKQPFIMNKL